MSSFIVGTQSATMASSKLHHTKDATVDNSLLNTPFYPGKALADESFRHLPKPYNSGQGRDPISTEQLARLDNHKQSPPPIPFLSLAAPGTPTYDAQIRALTVPQRVRNLTGTHHARFVTDSSGKSGRVYDRLHAHEVPRLVPYYPDRAPGQWYDVLTSQVRKRMLMDDFRDVSKDRALDVSVAERGEVWLPVYEKETEGFRDGGKMREWLAGVEDGIAGAQDWETGVREYRSENERVGPGRFGLEDAAWKGDRGRK